MNRFFTLLLTASCLTAVGQAPFEIIYSNDSTSFFFQTNPATWQEAQNSAIAWGGHLATFSDSVENFAILSILPVNPLGYWFGLNQAGYGEEPDGGWGWITGEDLSFTGWSLGEPNDSDSGNPGEDEDCGEIFENGWNDQYCHELNQFIVEIPNFKLGCTEESACNYKVDAFIDDGSCHFNCQFCHDGTEWDEDLFKCIVANPSDSNFDGCVQLNDLLDLLSAYGDCGAEESPWQCGDPLEYQGYNYETVQIGEQCWFAENLRAENYRDGEAIPKVQDESDWSSASVGSICSYDNTDENLLEYGLLYNGFAVVDSRGICPAGWNTPTEMDWNLLESEVGVPTETLDQTGWRGTTEQGGARLRSDNNVLYPSQWAGTNSTGFNGIPSGLRYPDSNEFSGIGINAFWWTTTSQSANHVWVHHVANYNEGIYKWPYPMEFGFSVRCVIDSE